MEIYTLIATFLLGGFTRHNAADITTTIKHQVNYVKFMREVNRQKAERENKTVTETIEK